MHARPTTARTPDPPPPRLACRAVAPAMRAAGYGRIVTLASALGLTGSAARASWHTPQRA